MTNKISQLAKTIAKVIGLASATLPVSQSFAQPTSSENSGNTIEYSTAKTTRSTIPVLKLSLLFQVTVHIDHTVHTVHIVHIDLPHLYINNNTLWKCKIKSIMVQLN